MFTSLNTPQQCVNYPHNVFRGKKINQATMDLLQLLCSNSWKRPCNFWCNLYNLMHKVNVTYSHTNEISRSMINVGCIFQHWHNYLTSSIAIMQGSIISSIVMPTKFNIAQW
jgi:hypothetical protein